MSEKSDNGGCFPWLLVMLLFLSHLVNTGFQTVEEETVVVAEKTMDPGFLMHGEWAVTIIYRDEPRQVIGFDRKQWDSVNIGSEISVEKYTGFITHHSTFFLKK